ncbi:MAG: tRNA (N6-threonylcarbamoyladenosine(37)-N6)-methyltransferase TrmO [Oscillospiraceae bacterium]|nr:tRNA (N6-threonylcarbamoyladenosine(37)-N6)-methyltransferase TrmO [Oscillospiraceae bacterium]
MEFSVKQIAHIENDFPSKFGIPRQSGLVNGMVSKIVFEPEYRNAEALRGIEGYSYLWLIWQFSEAVRDTWSPTVRPPRLGGNKRVGVFATRSPFRPNNLGLSSVKLVSVTDTSDKGKVLLVTGADLMNGTPIFDVKPYIAYTDSHPEAVSGFADEFVGYALTLDFSDELLSRIDENDRTPLCEVLKNDPRPSYQHDAERVYTMDYGKYAVSFRVDGETLVVTQVTTRQ